MGPMDTGAYWRISPSGLRLNNPMSLLQDKSYFCENLILHVPHGYAIRIIHCNYCAIPVYCTTWLSEHVNILFCTYTETKQISNILFTYHLHIV